AMQKPAIKPRTWALSPSPRAGHAWVSGVKSIAASSHCSDSASITKVSYLADIDQLLPHVERNRGHPAWRVPQVPRLLTRRYSYPQAVEKPDVTGLPQVRSKGCG